MVNWLHPMMQAPNAFTLFNWPYYDTDNPYGILIQEHFEAMERFWTQVVTKRAPTSAQPQTALVRPQRLWDSFA